ncbi:hypothetical protein C0995_012650 [Termitomyces sp. Mi166|nr:hypothetical protein C0995_012650 [Termitomyces sp. Mi166\
MQKPAELIKQDGSFHQNNNSLVPLSDTKIEEHDKLTKEWLQKEAQVYGIIYGTVDQSIFHQIKGEPTVATVWKKFVSIHGDKGAMYETNLLTQLQNTHFIENSETNMHTHLTNMVIIKDCLAKIRCIIFDASFVSYIQTSLFLAPSYKLLFTTLMANAHATRKLVTSQDLIWHLNKEANSAAIGVNIDHQHEAMMVTHAKAQGKSKDGKNKSKNKGKDGRGMAGKALNWWIKKHKEKDKDKINKSKLNNVAEATETDEKEENYVFLTSLTINADENDNDDNVALAITSGHNDKAHAVSPSASIIIDCGASRHFAILQKNSKLSGNQF